MTSRRNRYDLENPGLPEALAAFTALLDAAVTESEYGRREEDGDRIAECSDVLDRAADRAERERAAADESGRRRRDCR
ncbi:hypothetical protein GCM10010402_62180 [Actinomadura luteofluorescens]|uniref:hypothetical protein n=1 Tax=Actinomadura luteofluorescens TaxID=46163 RepID=UPI002164812B|nr:hypothetical protein [Actinomadura glauciflava]MCR3742876.1 hypothetical protein [Actinomadura glauciflava]